MIRRRGWMTMGWILLVPIPARAQTLEEGIALFKADKYAAAEPIIAAASAKDPNNPVAQFYMGRVDFVRDRYETSAGWFEKAVALKPNDGAYHHWLGRAYGLRARHSNMLVKGRLALKIKSSFEKAVELDPKNFEARDDLIQFYIEAPGFLGGSKEKAWNTVKAIGELNEREGRLAAGHYYAETGEPQKGVEIYLAAEKEGALAATNLARLGNAYRELGDKAKASDAYQRALKLEPEQKEAKEGLAKLK